MVQHAYDFLKDDPKVGYLVEACPLLPIPQIDLPFDLYLIKSIVSQQLSTKAAATIYSRFEKLFPESTPTLNGVIEIDREKLRSAGLSYSKAEYAKNVAQYFMNNEVTNLIDKSDQEIISDLTSIKGVGTWTVQMLLIFKLNRPDILPLEDLIVRKGIMSILDVNEYDKESKAYIIEHANRWKPHRSYISRLMWAAKGNQLLDI